MPHCTDAARRPPISEPPTRAELAGMIRDLQTQVDALAARLEDSPGLALADAIARREASREHAIDETVELLKTLASKVNTPANAETIKAVAEVLRGIA